MGRAGSGAGGMSGGGRAPGGRGSGGGGRPAPRGPMGGGHPAPRGPIGGGRPAPRGPMGGHAAPPPPRRRSPFGAALLGAAIGAAFAPRHRCPPPPYGYRYKTSYTYDECLAVLDALYHIRDGMDTPQDRLVVRQYFDRDVMPHEAQELIVWLEDYLS